ncbi:NADH dehydrogenase subunit F [Thermopolyspora flexuosa]|uniref:NAD-dependent formate dehydrogenase flavoprotein subunit n=1 Tax=Thermopolyspora flexuosa TaxID=103836 RepID=A0A543J0A6_9ACTN|nr:NAD(P)H-dependent oxidoreductase subunit E [Thermopolyspora flexuosa]TQM76248.1 NAD-dependent formate dehydrogenase flavoprotein subunit [Thermopolyspora flexuosa]GGM65921.1 NADH dehydrogenase subunit F [Thermopolyspora flexuosa]
MDIRFRDVEPTAEERAAVDALLGPAPSAWEGGERSERDLRVAVGGHAARERRDLLLPALHAVNDRVGWISEGALDYICRRLTIPPAEAYGVATFYSLFSTKPRPQAVLHVCTDIACQAKGADQVRQAVEERLGPPGLSWHPSPCLGLCERAPAALTLRAGETPSYTVYGPADPETVAEVAEVDEPPAERAVPQAGQDGLVLLRRVGVVDPASLDDYRAHGGYTALRRAFELGPAGVIREVLDSGLVGRGGAAFPTGRKWQATASRPDRPKYLVCNADESEPGTFKDRVIMEGDPYALIEAMTIAGYAIGASRGYLYIRGEYPRALRRLEHAIATARARGFLGERVMGQDFSFDIEIRRGAGAYICGEETAIFNSIEGRRGEPRSKPPFPVEKGLFGKPTVVNNVETLVNVPVILTMGAEAYRAIGTGGSTGPKLFCVSGTVRRPGVYELPFGATLRDLLELAGGVPEGRTLRAVLLGGAAGAFVRGDELDIPLTFEGTRAAGATLGSGVVLVLDDSVELPGILLRIAEFFREESCGQCVPCRVGTVRQHEALNRLRANGRSPDGDIALLREVGQAMRDASICGLGQTAWNAIESAIDRLGVFNATQGVADGRESS